MNTDQVITRLGRMWSKLGQQFATAASEDATTNPARSIHMALCAEACFWKATGETDSHDIKDVLPIIAITQDKRADG